MAAPTPITRERVFALEAERNGIEGDIRAGLESLGPVGMTAPLVDSEGYPRADVDLFSVRTTRQRVIMLRNDLKAKNTELERALEALHALGPAVFTIPVVPAGSAVGGGSGGPRGAPIAFVDSVSTGSPADSARLAPSTAAAGRPQGRCCPQLARSWAPVKTLQLWSRCCGGTRRRPWP